MNTKSQSAKRQFELSKLQFYQLTTNEFTVKDPLALVKETTKSNYNYVMGSLNVENLFIITSTDETIKNCIHNLPLKKSKNGKLTKKDVCDSILLQQKNLFFLFIFDSNLHCRIDSVTI